MDILVVEDEDSIRRALARALERDGHRVRAVASIADARRAWAEAAADCVISDLKLPDGDGLDTALDFGVPFVMLSGYATFDDAVRALRGGAVDFFTKPVSLGDIRAALRRIAPRPPATAAWLPIGAPTEAWWRSLPGPLARLAASELLQAARQGHIAARVDETGVRLWLDAEIDWAAQEERRAWLAAHGIVLASAARAGVAVVPAESPQPYAAEREALQPLDADGPILASGWISAGSWLLSALRRGAGPCIGLAEELCAALRRCGVEPPLAPSSLAVAGLSGAERAALLDGGDLDCDLLSSNADARPQDPTHEQRPPRSGRD